MKEDKKQQFCTLCELDILIDISIHNISMLLTPYVEFKGLVSTEEQPLLYVDGIFIAGKSNKHGIGHIETEFGVEEDIEESLIEIIGTKYSNNDSLIDKHLNIKANNSKDLDLKMYSYDEFIEVISKIGIPLFDLENPNLTKQFIYNVQQVNQKSNFTVDEASSIASNWFISNHIGPYPQITVEQSQLRKHNMDILCECIKGQNQQGFHLITKELWIKSTDPDYGEYNNQHPTSSKLTMSSRINIDLTIISKNEFIRWCEFMQIETGLTKGEEVENESVEFLKLEIERLRNIPPYPAPPKYPAPPAPRLQPTINELEEIKKELSIKEKEIETLKENAFIVMTETLKVMKDAQIKYWKDYDPNNIPTQKTINFFISEKLGLIQTGDNRKAAELAKAIKPIE